MTDEVRHETDPGIVDEWMVVYEQSAAELTRFASMIVGDSAAEDVVADAVLAVLRSVDRSPAVASSSYLYRAVSNTAKNHLRSAGRRRWYESRAARLAPLAGTEQEMQPRSEVLDVLGRLSGQQRAVVFLTYWLDLTPPQVAEHLGVAEGSVRSQLARARRKLRGVFDG